MCVTKLLIMKSKKYLNTKFIYLISVVFFLSILSLNQDWYRIFNQKPLKVSDELLLKYLGKEAIKTLDIPISALLVYNDTVIGKGYNTVKKDNNAGGHAEINAISNALKNIGNLEFFKLNRDSLKLITSYEPCLMCKGAILNFKIKNVVFIEEKSISTHLKNTKNSFIYEFNKRKTTQNSLQIELFKLHPNYLK